MKKIIVLLALLFVMVLTTNVNALTERDYKENTYVFEPSYSFKEQAKKDLVVFTDKLNFSGTVNKDLWVLAGESSVVGIIGDDLRILSGKTRVNALVFNDLLFVGNSLLIDKDTMISGNLYVNAKRAEIRGEVHGDAKIKANEVYISGLIRQDIEIIAEKLEVSPEAKIIGHVTLSPGLEVDETMIKNYSYGEEILVKTVKDMFIGKIALFLMILLLGGTIFLILRNKAKKFSETMQHGFLLSFLIGLLIFLGTPFLIMLLLITIIGIPLAIALGALYLLMLIVSPIFLSILLGRTTLGLFKKKTLLGLELMLGAIIFLCIMLIPRLIAPLIVVSGSVTMGALVLTLYGWKKPKKRKTINIKAKKKSKKK